MKTYPVLNSAQRHEDVYGEWKHTPLILNLRTR